MTPDERLRAEFEEWNATVTPCATIALQEAARENYCFPDLEMCVKAERDRAYRAAAEKRDGEIELQDQDIHRLQELCGNLKLENDQLKELYYPRRPPEEDEG